MRGAFITIEGGEGVGKSTSLAAVEATLRDLGHTVVTTREPGGTQLGEQVRSLILDGRHEGLKPETEVLLMFAARAQHLADVIRPALERGDWVLCDRFTDATMAYQGGGRGLPVEFIADLEARVQRGLRPDLTLLLDAPAAVGYQRIRDRELDHFEREGLEFLERVRQAYLEIAEREPERVEVVDASASPEAVAAALSARVRRFAGRFEPDTMAVG